MVHGNTHCSFSGIDISTQWQKPHPQVFSEIFYLKKMIGAFRDLSPMVFELRMTNRHSNSHLRGSSKEAVTDHVLPLLLSKLDDSVLFPPPKISANIEGTMAQVLPLEFGVNRIYTLMLSMGGCTQGSHTGHQVTNAQAKQLGVHLCQVRIAQVTVTMRIASGNP